MKQKLPLLSMAAVCAMLLSACQQQPSSPNEGLTTNIVTSPAHPALTYYGMVNVEGPSYPAIWVMDTDGSHQTPVQIAASSANSYYSPSWSPTGGSICFTKGGMGVVPDSIKAFDLIADPSGSPTGRNLRTIFGLSDPSLSLSGPCWSSTTSVGKIAYWMAGYTMRGQTTSTLCVVPQSGGKPVNVLSVRGPLSLDYCTWSPDDSRLAVVRANLPTEATIMIFNTATWACVDSIPLTGTVLGLEWSRAGLNKLAFGMRTTSQDPYILYTCDPKTDAIPVTDNVPCYLPTWSPSNASLMYWQYGVGLLKTTSFTPLTTQVNPSVGALVKWKR